jgi:type IV secretion system protein VirB8
MKDAQAFFSSSQSWAIDQQEAGRRSRRVAWAVAGAACGVAVLEAIALIMLMPLKTTTPVALLVDRTTGYVQSIDPSRGQQIRADEALVQSLLAQYVSTRERFDRATVKVDYRRVALWSAGSARARYIGAMAGSNPESPLNFYRSGEVVSAEVKSVSRLASDTALVRFDTFLTGGDGRSKRIGSWISTLRYRFSDAAMSYDDRLVNPLGLQISSYRRDSERPKRDDGVDESVARPPLEDGPPAARIPQVGAVDEVGRSGDAGQ